MFKLFLNILLYNYYFNFIFNIIYAKYVKFDEIIIASWVCTHSRNSNSSEFEFVLFSSIKLAFSNNLVTEFTSKLKDKIGIKFYY